MVKNVSIKKKDINLRIISFIIYNIIYAFYMSGYISRNLNIISLLIFTIICIISGSKKKKYTFVPETKKLLFFIIYVIFVSFIRQVYYRDVNISLFSGLLYVILPIVVVFFVVNTSEKDEVKRYLYIIFFRMIFLFLLTNYNNLSLTNFLMINWGDSQSSLFESSMAHEFMFMVVVFKYLKKDIYAFISMIFCILCFKRLAFLCAVSFYFFYDFIFKKEEVSKRVILVVKFLFILTPFITLFIVSKEGQELFYNLFKIPLNQFTTGRTYYINLVLSNMQYYNGYGSTHNYLLNIYGDTYVTSIHCDLLRLFLECGFLSVFICVNSWFNIIRRKRVLFYLMSYAFLEMFVSHFLEGMGIWMIFYLFIYLVLYEGKSEKSE